MADITRELNEIKAANWGGGIRSAIALALEKVNEGGGDSDSGLFVVTTLEYDSNSEDPGPTGDMTKAEIIQAISDGKIVLVQYRESGGVLFGFVSIAHSGILTTTHLFGDVSCYMTGQADDDCILWNFAE